MNKIQRNVISLSFVLIATLVIYMMYLTFADVFTAQRMRVHASASGVEHFTVEIPQTSQIADIIDAAIIEQEARLQARIEEEARIAAEQARIEAELSIATFIEANYQLPQGNTELTTNFIREIAQDAVTVAEEYDLFASVLIAQAIIESGNGTSGLSLSPHYNLFGIKGTYNGAGRVWNTWGDDGNGNVYDYQATFRSYPSRYNSIRDYARLLRNGLTWNPYFYRPAWRSVAETTYNATAHLQGTFAMDTNYASKLNNVIARYNLTRFDQPLNDYALAWINSSAMGIGSFEN